MRRTGLAVLVLGAGLAACASMPPPHEREANSEAAIRAAREVGAQQIPQAALHLTLAQEQLEKGKALMRDGDNEEAAFMLQRAQADAELALAMTHESQTQMEAQRVIDRARAIGGGPSSDAPKQPSPAATTQPDAVKQPSPPATTQPAPVNPPLAPNPVP